MIVQLNKNFNKKIKKSRTDIRATWLSPFLSPITFGQKTAFGVRPRLTIDKANEYLQNGWSGKLSGRKQIEHHKGDSTYYYWADLNSESLLLCIDIDCKHGVGTYEGAVKFAEHLKATLFPGLYFEKSTNGNGVHGYFILENTNLSWGECNELAKRIQSKLRAIAIETGANISGVEIKGQPPEVVKGGQWTRTPQGWRLPRPKVLRYGQHAKLPRLSTLDHLDRLKTTTRLTPEDVRGEQYNTTPTVKTAVRKEMADSGSVAWFTPKDAAHIRRIESWAKSQELDGIQAGSRHVVRAVDFAIALFICHFIGEDIKGTDKAMRTKRIKGLWNCLYENGVVSRGFDCHRFKIIRNTLSERGLLDWESNVYYPPVNGKGKAMVWRLGAELCSVMDGIKKGNKDTTPVGTNEILIGAGEILYPEERFSLTTDSLIRWEQQIETYDFALLAA